MWRPEPIRTLTDSWRRYNNMLDYSINEEQLKELTERLDRIEANTTPQEHEITKEEIFAVKDRTKRQQLIAENMHLFE